MGARLYGGCWIYFGQFFDLLVAQVALLVGLLVDELDGVEFVFVVLNKLLPVLDEDFGLLFVVSGGDQFVGAVVDELVGVFAAVLRCSSRRSGLWKGLISSCPLWV